MTPRILLVEDDRVFSTQVLEAYREKYDIKLIHSKDEVISYLENGNHFDLIILDLHLTEKPNRENPDGFELIPRIRAIYPRIPILVFTVDESREITYKVLRDFKADIGIKNIVTFEELSNKIDSLIFESPQISAFISYSWKDGIFVEKLGSKLQENGIAVLIDKNNIKAGNRFIEVIADLIEKCDFFLLILSPDSVESPWVLKELTLASEKNKKIIPIICREGELPNQISLLIAGKLRVSFTELEKKYDEKVSEITKAIFS